MFALILLMQFFEKPDVDFWGTKKKGADPPPWVEPGHTPPEPVVRLLEEPTHENARAYLQWQEDRLARLRAALEAIEEVQSSAPPTDRREILYFAQEGCPHCAEQDRRLEAADLGERPLRRLTPRDAPELWERYKVTATPTLVIDGRVLRGLRTRDQIEELTR
ncbi:MAG: thioredoxin family protein [Planctomycetes bacterium]|nr:thioredoxin family protein [Planctomycetota bacterium]